MRPFGRVGPHAAPTMNPAQRAAIMRANQDAALARGRPSLGDSAGQGGNVEVNAIAGLGPINSTGTGNNADGAGNTYNTSTGGTSLSTLIKEGSSSSSSNFKVCIRVRPPLASELDSSSYGGFKSTVAVTPDHKGIALCESFPEGTVSSVSLGQSSNSDATAGASSVLVSLNGVAESAFPLHRFAFDYVYDETSRQEEVYMNTAKELVASTLQGYNSTIFAYGQTGTGKTYTMEGIDSLEHQGIIPRAVTDIFDYILHQANAETKFLVRASYLQIYNETISDLLSPERTNLHIREDKARGIYVEGLSEWMVRSAKEIHGLIRRGASLRATGATKMNEVSSRSHAVFVIVVEQHSVMSSSSSSSTATTTGTTASNNSNNNAVTGAEKKRTLKSAFRVGKLNLVDLAGSERVSLTGASGQRLEESKRINQSLSALGNVIAALTTDKGVCIYVYMIISLDWLFLLFCIYPFITNMSQVVHLYLFCITLLFFTSFLFLFPISVSSVVNISPIVILS